MHADHDQDNSCYILTCESSKCGEPAVARSKLPEAAVTDLALCVGVAFDLAVVRIIAETSLPPTYTYSMKQAFIDSTPSK